MFFKKNPVKLYLKGLPKHLGIIALLEDTNAIDAHIQNIKKCIETIVKLRIPILSLYLLPLDHKEDVGRYNDYLSMLMLSLHNWKYIDEKQIKISVLGNWYDLPNRVVEPIKQCVDSTKSYDRTFVNLCINYSGHQEIVSAMKLLGRKIELDKMDADEIDAELIKEHLSTSYFIPPELIIVTGTKPCLDGFLLWDSPKSAIDIVRKPWHKFGVVDLVSSMRKYQKMR